MYVCIYILYTTGALFAVIRLSTGGRGVAETPINYDDNYLILKYPYTWLTASETLFSLNFCTYNVCLARRYVECNRHGTRVCVRVVMLQSWVLGIFRKRVLRNSTTHVSPPLVIVVIFMFHSSVHEQPSSRTDSYDSREQTTHKYDGINVIILYARSLLT